MAVVKYFLSEALRLSRDVGDSEKRFAGSVNRQLREGDRKTMSLSREEPQAAGEGGGKDVGEN